MKISIALFAFLAVGLPSLIPAQSKLPAPAVTAYRPVAPVRSATVTPRAKTAATSTFGSNTGWGSVANPGTGHPPNTTASGSPRNNYNTGTGKRQRNSSVGAYAYPVYIPGYADSVTANPYASNPGGDQQYTSDRPPVVIQNFYPTTFTQQPQGGPQQMGDDSNMQTYIAPAQAPVMQTPADTAVNSGNYYLIAYKDHHIYSALAYWMEGTTVHYVTTQNMHNQVPLDSVDVDLTKRLNQDRNISLTAAQ